MKKINIAELLKDCPKGMELDCTMYDNVEFEGISNNKDWPIAISVEGYPEVLNSYGCISYRDYTKCVIFPKGKTTWEGFVPPIQFRDGDIAATDCNCSESQLFIVSGGDSQKQMKCYVSLFEDGKLDVDAGNYYVTRYATEEEKQKLFKAIKDNGYKWNPETKTLDKLIEPKFKVGDIIKHKDSGLYCTLEEYSEGKFYIIKKQPQYPKTYEECAEILLERASVRNDIGYKGDLLVNLQRLLICRDAYWFIYNNWKPTHKSGCDNTIYTIHRFNEEVIKGATSHRHSLLEFPTEEMRDEFYENFKTLFFACKELI